MTIELDLDIAIHRAKLGDEAGIVLLFRSFNPQLIRYLRHHVPYDYEDVASETWVAIAKGISDFNGNSRDFRAWMFGISRNKVADFFRTAKKSGETLDRVRKHLKNHDYLENSDWTAGPAVSNLSAEEAIETLIGVLSPHHAEVLLLRVVGDLSVEEVAKLMGKSPEAIRVIQHRALNTLAKRFHRNVVT